MIGLVLSRVLQLLPAMRAWPGRNPVMRTASVRAGVRHRMSW
jgi:hypothetical protein